MSAPFERIGKQVLANGYHYADGADEKAAEFIFAKLTAGWQPIAALASDDYVLGWTERSDGCTNRSYFLGRRYDIREGCLINEWTGRWRSVTHWMPLPTAPAAA